MTIPTLMNKTNNQEIVSKLKKSYSALSNATNAIISEEGMPRGDIGGWATDIDTVYNLYKKHLQISKDCGSGSGCFSGNYKHLKKSSTHNFNSNTNHRKFILSDGTPIVISGISPAVSQSCNNLTDGNGTSNYCLAIYADINGEKGPKIVGRDLFAFVVKEDGLHPVGCDADGYCALNYSGYACACKVLREGAINY